MANFECCRAINLPILLGRKILYFYSIGGEVQRFSSIYFKRGANFTYSHNYVTASPEFVVIPQNEPKCNGTQTEFCVYMYLNIIWLYEVTYPTLLASLSNKTIGNYV